MKATIANCFQNLSHIIITLSIIALHIALSLYFQGSSPSIFP
jgi:hypothetical protein